LPKGTVLARAKREGSSKQLQDAKAVALPQSSAVTPMQSVAAVMLLIAIRRRIGRLRAARPPPSKSSEGPHDGALPVRMLVIRHSSFGDRRLA